MAILITSKQIENKNASLNSKEKGDLTLFSLKCFQYFASSLISHLVNHMIIHSVVLSDILVQLAFVLA